MVDSCEPQRQRIPRVRSGHGKVGMEVAEELDGRESERLTLCPASRSTRSSGAREYTELEVEVDENEYDLTPLGR